MFFLALLSFFAPQPIQTDAPFLLEVSFEGRHEYDGAWRLQITFQAREDLGESEIWVEASDGLKVDSGSLFWHGKLKSGEKAEIEIAMRLTDAPPQGLTVNLVGRTARGQGFSQKIHRAVAFISDRL